MGLVCIFKERRSEIATGEGRTAPGIAWLGDGCANNISEMIYLNTTNSSYQAAKPKEKNVNSHIRIHKKVHAIYISTVQISLFEQRRTVEQQ